MKIEFYPHSLFESNSQTFANAEKCFNLLLSRQGKGNDFLGWLDLPQIYNDANFIENIVNSAKKFQKFDVVVIVGIGGSYLGAKAVIEALKPHFEKTKPEIIFAGHTLSEDYYCELIKYLQDKSFGIVVISKSGTTTEPAIAFRLLLKELKKKYNDKEIENRVIAITDKEKGALKEIAVNENYKTYIIPDDVGGRFSVLTAVGLLPIAIAGFDVKKLLQGAYISQKECTTLSENAAIKYAVFRNILYNSGKKIEILINYNPRLVYFSEWWKQLFGESEGKENLGIFPASASFTTDLHSLGQYIQQGERHLFETAIIVENTSGEVKIPHDSQNLDQLNYIADKSIEFVNQKAAEGTLMAHLNGNVPNCKITIEKLDEFNLGYLMFFFEMSCAISGYMLGVNPFDQPGVEDYKKNMFALLGK